MDFYTQLYFFPCLFLQRSALLPVKTVEDVSTSTNARVLLGGRGLVARQVRAHGLDAHLSCVSSHHREPVVLLPVLTASILSITSECFHAASPSYVCFPQSWFSVRKCAGTAACAWDSTGVVVLTGLWARCVKQVSVPRVLVQESRLFASCLRPSFFFPPACSCDDPLCAPLSTRRHLQSTQHLYLSGGHRRPALRKTVGFCRLRLN